MGHLLLWSGIEAGLGIIAASLPALRIFIRGYLEASSSAGNSSGVRVASHSIGGRKIQPLTPSALPYQTNIGGGKWSRLDNDLEQNDVMVCEEQMRTVKNRSSDNVELGAFPVVGQHAGSNV
jgi:hypothetical protein